MSDELRVSVTMKFDNGSVVADDPQDTFALDVSSSVIVKGVQSLAASFEEISCGDITSIGYCKFTNLSTSIICYLHNANTGSPLIKIEPGATVCFQPDTGGWGTIYARTEAGTANLKYFITSD